MNLLRAGQSYGSYPFNAGLVSAHLRKCGRPFLKELWGDKLGHDLAAWANETKDLTAEEQTPIDRYAERLSRLESVFAHTSKDLSDDQRALLMDLTVGLARATGQSLDPTHEDPLEVLNAFRTGYKPRSFEDGYRQLLWEKRMDRIFSGGVGDKYEEWQRIRLAQLLYAVSRRVRWYAADPRAWSTVST